MAIYWCHNGKGEKKREWEIVTRVEGRDRQGMREQNSGEKEMISGRGKRRAVEGKPDEPPIHGMDKGDEC
jgi:hypothetical protein